MRFSIFHGLHEKSMKNQRLFSDQVMPRFTTQPALSGTK
jgi:hypothetical protein